jgi:hypothetical protein
MASRAITLLAAMAVFAAVAALLPATASATSYTVGDGSGWDLLGRRQEVQSRRHARYVGLTTPFDTLS